MAPGLSEMLIRPILEAAGMPAETAAYATGTGDFGLASEFCGMALCWCFFYVGILGFYHAICPLCCAYTRWRHPDAPCNLVKKPMQQHMVSVSHAAFPLYVTVVLLTELFRKKGWSNTCDSLEECGGLPKVLVQCTLYFFTVELMIFLDHYYLLHKFDLGKMLMRHSKHHVYKKADELNAFSAFAFAPQDGWSQGLPLALCTLVYRVPLVFVLCMEIATAFWTLYIHTDVLPLPWPIMGCDYHYVHHKYNWYNFGFMTRTFDYLFGTLKTPTEKDYENFTPHLVRARMENEKLAAKKLG